MLKGIIKKFLTLLLNHQTKRFIVGQRNINKLIPELMTCLEHCIHFEQAASNGLSTFFASSSSTISRGYLLSHTYTC
jgi:hypothetical protein